MTSQQEALNGYASRRWAAFHAQRGIALPVVMIAVTFGMAVVIPLVALLASSTSVETRTLEDEEAYYAADAGVQAVVKDLRSGLDALAGGYTLPSVTVNSLTPAISVIAPPIDDLRLFGPVYVDPETGTNLSTLAPGASYTYQIDNVRASTDIAVNWVFTSTTKWQVTIFEGAGTGGTRIVQLKGKGTRVLIVASAKLISGGTYTIRFRNDDAVNTISTAAFNSSGAITGTWINTTAFKGYLITSTAGSRTLTVLARQSPGPTQSTRAVQVSSWKN